MSSLILCNLNLIPERIGYKKCFDLKCNFNIKNYLLFNLINYFKKKEVICTLLFNLIYWKLGLGK